MGAKKKRNEFTSLFWGVGVGWLGSTVQGELRKRGIPSLTIPSSGKARSSFLRQFLIVFLIGKYEVNQDKNK
jgi:hypothetical protein